ncbi:LCI fold-containing protein [Photorhabdus laumondii]|uniref:LCI fold-containing protein n=1 Tax=Photorhabdus laumondii TaxID=2218628 RepID=UPI003314F4B8
MFKKLLAIGVLVTGITLTGGIGVASASVYIPWDNCYSSGISHNNGLYTQYIAKDNGNFPNIYDWAGVRWYLKGYKYLDYCGKYIALYEGRGL